MISRCVPANYNSVFLVTFMIQHQFIPGFSFLGCLGAVYVKDSFPPEKEALSWPNSDASFEELFKTHRKLSRGLGLPPSWWPDHKRKQKMEIKEHICSPSCRCWHEISLIVIKRRSKHPKMRYLTSKLDGKSSLFSASRDRKIETSFYLLLRGWVLVLR